MCFIPRTDLSAGLDWFDSWPARAEASPGHLDAGLGFGPGEGDR